jgi:hypothetical protein
MTNTLYVSYKYHRQNRAKPAVALTMARDDTAAGRFRYPAPMRPHAGNWQRPDDMPRFAPSSRAYYCDEWPAGFRLVGRADEVARKNDRWRTIDHSGWYTSDDGDNGIYAGFVLRLPHGRLVPGIKHSEWHGATLFPLAQEYDETECARAADQYAERAADIERDYNRAWQAGAEAAEQNSQAADIRRRIIQLCSDLRSARRLVPSDDAAIVRLCDNARHAVQDMLGELARHRRQRDKLRGEYGAEPAFADGYGSA